jgi:SAM-dependent methyltransferase
MVSKENKLRQVLSPLTGSNHVLLENNVPCSQIIDAYKSLNIDVSDYFLGLESIQIYRCLDSGYRFYYPFTLAGNATLYESLENFPWYYMDWRWDHQVARELSRGASSILEIGCGRGNFLQKMQNEIKRCVGLEFNQSAIQEAQSRGLEVHLGSVESYAHKHPGEFDIVCGFQVLEHVPQPREFIQAAVELIKPGGLLILSVPNNDAFMFMYDDIQTLNRPPHHVGLWDQNSLVSLTGFFPLQLQKLVAEPLQLYHRESAQYILDRLLQSIYGVQVNKMLNQYKPIVRMVSQAILQRIPGHTLVACYSKNETIGSNKETLRNYPFNQNSFETMDGICHEQQEVNQSGAWLLVDAFGTEKDEFITSLTSKDDASLLTADKLLTEKLIHTQGQIKVSEYSHYFPRDAYLALWAGLIFQQEERHFEAMICFTRAILNEFPHWRVFWYFSQAAEKAGYHKLMLYTLQTVVHGKTDLKEASHKYRKLSQNHEFMLKNSDALKYSREYFRDILGELVAANGEQSGYQFPEIVERQQAQINILQDENESLLKSIHQAQLDFILPMQMHSRPGSRVVHFTDKGSIGKLQIRPWNSKGWDWRNYGDAQGDVQVPAGVELYLTISAAGKLLLDTLATLQPHDIQSLFIGHTNLLDEELNYLTNLTGLKTLDLRSTQITDVGLSALERMKNMNTLILPLQISNEAINQLKSSLSGCNILRDQ